MSDAERFLWRRGDVTIIRAPAITLSLVVVGPYLAERDGKIVPVEGYSYIREGAEVEFLDVPTHIEDLSDASAMLWASEMRDQGVSIKDVADEIESRLTSENLDHGRRWYPDALDLAADISKESDIEIDRVVAAFAAMSPRCQWQDPDTGEGETKYVRSLAKFIGSGAADGLTADEAAVAWKQHYKKSNTVLGLVKGERVGDPVGASVFNGNTAKAIRVMRGETSPGALLRDNKTRSFYNNILFPNDPGSVTIDTHMMKAFERVYGVTYKDADVFARHDRKDMKRQAQVRGVGYITIAEAVREVARRTGESPSTIQAAYWLSVQDTPHIEDGQPWPGRDPVMAFARALDYLDTDFELLPAYSPEEVALNRLTDAEVEMLLEREQEEADRYGSEVELARVDVERYLRIVQGKVQDVEAYHYRREGVTPQPTLKAVPEPPPLPKMTIKTLLPEDQEIVRAALPPLLSRYPSVAKQIKLVKANFQRTTWGVFSDDGVMQLNNQGARYKDLKDEDGNPIGHKYRDPTLAVTVAHEFGHAIMHDLSGHLPTDEMRAEIKALDKKMREYSLRSGRLRAGQRMRYLPSGPMADKRNEMVEAMNVTIRERRRIFADLTKEVMGRVGEAFSEGWEDEPDYIPGGSPEGHKRRVIAQRLHKQIVEEFAEMPEYVLSSQEELFAQAFAHYWAGKHGIISDIVGKWIDEKYQERERASA